MKPFSLWNKLVLMVLVLVASACAKNELPETDEEDGEYYVTITVNDERVEYKSGVWGALSSPPKGDIDYQQFSLTVAGAGAIKGKEALFLNCFVYDTWKITQNYENTFEPDEMGSAAKQHQISLQYLNETLASQYLHVSNDSFTTGSAKVVLTEVTSTYIRGTFQGVLGDAVLAAMTPQGNVVKVNPPLTIKGEFYVPNR